MNRIAKDFAAIRVAENMSRLLLFFPFFLVPCTVLQAQPHFFQMAQEAYAQGMTAYEAKDYATSLAYFERALNLRPNHPGIMYNVAATGALSGNVEKALGMLNKIADMNVRFPAEKDPDFSLLLGNQNFEKVIQRFNNLEQPVGTPTVAFTLPEKDLVTESVAFDPKTENFFVSSIHKRKIVALSPDGKISDFIRPAQDGLWAVFAMNADMKRRSLYVSSSAMKEMNDFKSEEKGVAGIFQYDIDLGTLTRHYVLSNEKAQHVLGDLVVKANGNIFATDSRYNAVYRFSPAAATPEEFIPPGEFASLQGLTFSGDEEWLFVADYSQGIFRINMGTREVDRIAHADTICTLGIDGLYFYLDRLVAVQNGVRPHRVVSLALNEEYDTITDATILAANHPRMEDPTLGTIVGDEFYFIANSQWGSFDKEGHILPDDRLQEPTILKVKLGE